MNTNTNDESNYAIIPGDPFPHGYYADDQPILRTRTQSHFASFEALVHLVTDGVDSPHTKRMYVGALRHFTNWYVQHGTPPLTKALIQSYVDWMRMEGKSASVINQKLSVVKKMVREAADNDLLNPQTAQSILHAKGVKQRGKRLGYWLTMDQVSQLVNTPDLTTLSGVRDRAVLAVLVGCGLRREEAANLTFGHIQLRNNRWVIVDLEGKGNRIRSVPIPDWVKATLDDWTYALENEAGQIFHTKPTERVWRAINKADRLTGVRAVRGGCIAEGYISGQAIEDIVNEYGIKAGFDQKLDAHDLRRTFAKLTRAAGAPIEQIQLSLGHASAVTTERYLGTRQDLEQAPGDMLKVTIAQRLSRQGS